MLLERKWMSEMNLLDKLIDVLLKWKIVEFVHDDGELYFWEEEDDAA